MTINWAEEARIQGLRKRDGSVRIETDEFDHTPDHKDTSRVKNSEYIMWNHDRSVMIFGANKIPYRRLIDSRLRNFYVASSGKVRNKHGKLIRDAYKTARKQVRLPIAPNVYRYYYKQDLVEMVWPELRRIWRKDVLHFKNEMFTRIPIFSDYVMHKDGRVLRLKTGEFLRNRGLMYFLSIDGKQIGRSVNVLYEQTFGENPRFQGATFDPLGE